MTPKPPYRYHVLPCSGPRCTPEKGEAFKGQLKDLLPDRKALGIRVSTTSCQGMCTEGPNVLVYPEGVVYHGVDAQDIVEIVETHLRGGCPVVSILERPLPQASAEKAGSPAARGDRPDGKDGERCE